MNGVHLVTDFKQVREIQTLLGRYANGPLDFFPVMSSISLSMRRITLLETIPYTISPKPTGTRFLMYFNASGEIFMENMTQHIFRVDGMKMVNCDGQPVTDSVLDGIMTGEKIYSDDFTTNEVKFTFVVMDAIRCNGVNLIDLNILQRIALVRVCYIIILKTQLFICITCVFFGLSRRTNAAMTRNRKWNYVIFREYGI